MEHRWRFPGTLAKGVGAPSGLFNVVTTQRFKQNVSVTVVADDSRRGGALCAAASTIFVCLLNSAVPCYVEGVPCLDKGLQLEGSMP